MPKKPYRIGIDARFYRKETSGLGRYTHELIDHLAKIDTSNDYFIFLTPEDISEWQLDQANFHPVVVNAQHYSWAEQIRFLKVLVVYKLDLVHFPNFNHPILYMKPFVSTLQDFTVYYHPVGRSSKNKLRRLAFVQTLKHSLTGAEKVIAISQNSALDAEKVFDIPSKKIRVIYEAGPDAVSDFDQSADQPSTNSDPYFLFVSQWRPHKGILTLIDAFNQFKAKTKLPHKLVLTGSQKTIEKDVKDKIAKSPYRDSIVAPGFVPDELLANLYHSATACVVPSEYEGFGLMVLEAFSYQVPVICADNSSLPEVGGNAPLYFPTKDAKVLAEKMEQLANDPKLASEMIKKGIAQLNKFSWDKCAAETHEVYMEVLTKKKTAR